MLMVITGGSGSGKSEFAEKQAVRLQKAAPCTIWLPCRCMGKRADGRWNVTGSCGKGKALPTIERTTRVDLAEPEAGADSPSGMHDQSGG